MKALLKRIAKMFSRNGNGATPDANETVDPEKITRKNVEHETGKIQRSILRARAELKCVEQKLGPAPAECAD